jgi:hypothetical protein
MPNRTCHKRPVDSEIAVVECREGGHLKIPTEASISSLAR